MEDVIGVQRPKHPVGEYVHHPLSPLENKRGNPYQGRLVDKDEQSKSGAQDSSSDSDSDSDDAFHDASESLDEHGYTSEQHRSPNIWVSDHMKSESIHRPHMRTDKSLPQLPEEAQQLNDPGEPSKQENPKMTGNDPSNEGTVTASGGVLEKSRGYRSNKVKLYEASGGYGRMHAQIVRSSADWSSGILTESSIQNAYCQVIRAAKHYVYIENQFFITATGDKQSPVHNLIGKAIVDACLKADKEQRKFKVIILLPPIPGFAGDLRSEAAAGTRAIMDYQYKSICRGEESIFGRIKAEGVDPHKYIFIFNLRSYDRINKTPALKKQEESSGVKYQEVQRAEAEEIMGTGLRSLPSDSSTKDKMKSKGLKKLTRRNQPTSAKGVLKRGAKMEMESSESESDADAPSQKNAMSNAERMKQFEERRHDVGLTNSGKDDTVLSSDSIAQDAMLGEKNVTDENYAGRWPGVGDGDEEELREQEKENFIQEELYIHAKVRDS